MNAKELVLYFFEEVYNKHRTAAIYECYVENYYEHRPTGARCSADSEKIVQGALQVFPDISVKVGDAVQEGDLVAVRVWFTATQKGTFAGLPATGKTISWEAMEFFRIENGLITESWGAWPTHDMLEALKS